MIQAYNYMIESHLPKQMSKSRAHKKDELKKIYENIVKLSRNSGFYKINLTKENQLYTIGMKETALLLKAKLQELQDPDWSGYNQKQISVSNHEILEAELIGDPAGSIPDTLMVTVDNLASPQVNRGLDLFHPSHSLKRGVYDFRLHIRNKTYDLTFHQTERTTNRDTIGRLANYLNQMVPELTVVVEEVAGKEYSHIVLRENITGKTGERNFYFEESDLYREGIVELFGLNNMEKAPSNADFTINGAVKQASSNTFYLEKAIKVTLKDVDEQPVLIRLIRDPNVLFDQVDSLLNTFNELLYTAEIKKEESGGSYSATKLINELQEIKNNFRHELDACGLIDDAGTLIRDKEISGLAASDGRLDEFIMKKNGFITRLLEKAEQIAINPMEYLDKVIVTYPDRKAMANPYVTSIYSGLFFNSYC